MTVRPCWPPPPKAVTRSETEWRRASNPLARSLPPLARCERCQIARTNVYALIRGFGDAQFIPGGRRATAILPLAWCRGRACRRLGDGAAGQGPGDYQGRHSAFAFRHYGDQRDDLEGCHADAHRLAEPEMRAARQEA